MKRRLVVSVALLIFMPSLVPAQELILHERKINRQRITTIACVPGPGMMMPAPGMMLPPGAVPGPGRIVPGPGNFQPVPGAGVPAPGGVVPAPEIEKGKQEVQVQLAGPEVAGPAAIPAATAATLDSTAWLDSKSFIDGQGRCWQQVSGQPYPACPIQICGLLLCGNDGSKQFFTHSGRLFKMGLNPALAKQTPAGQCATGRCSTGRCSGGQCQIIR